MTKFKLIQGKKTELVLYIIVLAGIITHAIVRGDYWVAVMSAICGITYTTFAGLGSPKCYLFGLAGSIFYIMLAFQNSLWGNLFLYLLYYVPMQIIGFFKWSNNLKENSKEIKKYSLTKKEKMWTCIISIVLSIIFIFVLWYFQDKHPCLDGITTALSIIAMYLTVRRAIEQWIMWFIVNLLSLLMWIYTVMSGTKATSILIMWVFYLFLSVYFYRKWKRELSL